jgi:sulfur-carrier protein
MFLTIKYFAWLRERVGLSQEQIDLPSQVTTISHLIDHLAARDEAYAYAFESKKLIRAAINKTHVSHDTLLKEAHEVAFFPPMTGG